jgi:TonB-linked SusC/RagA family outer membrane protein
MTVSGNKLERQLNQLLKPHGLSYKRIGSNQYVVVQELPKSAKKVVAPTINSPEQLPPAQRNTTNPPFPEANKIIEEVANKSVDRTITGTVTDETKAPLPGVSIVVKETGSTIPQRGTTTNATGNFSLAIPDEKAVLVFSYVGYEPQEIVVGNRTSLTISLKPDLKALEEVVVVGYGTQSKRNITGSISSVNLKQIETTPNTSIGQALRGRVAGVQFTDNGRPGQGGTILIRGQRSITAGNTPLIILDGIFYEGDIRDISPNDVESMEVLKDASATAIYGARAANGVILITTKLGKTDKPTIRFSVTAGTSQWANQPKLLTPERYIEKTLEYRRQVIPALPADLAQIATYLQATEAKNFQAGQTIDPWDLASQDASLQNYDLSVSGRSGRTNYFMSFNYNDEKGLVLKDNFNRTAVRLNLDNQITDWLKIGVSAQYAIRDNSGIPANLPIAFWTSPYASPWLDEAKTDPNPFPTEDNLVGSAIFSSILNQNNSKATNLFANFFGIFDVPFVKGLSYRINYSPNFRWTNIDNFSPVYRRNNLNNTGSASRSFARNETWVLENILTYNKQLTENHGFDVTLLYGRNQVFNQNLLANGSDFTTSSDANTWNNLALARIQTTSTGANQIDAISSMARLNYRFKNRYMATFTVRRDGSSVFGPNNKFAVFPSGALAWVASDEPFMKALPAVNLLKVRASYGSVGNQAISAYQTAPRQGQVQYVFGDAGATTVGFFPANLINPNLKWETTTTLNLGVDFELLKGRIGGTVEWYNMDTKDLIVNRALPNPTGFNNILTNIGKTNNKGVEVTLNTINLQKGKFEWSSNLVFSSNKNKIVSLYGVDRNGDGREDDDIGNRWFIGQPVQAIYDFVFDGIYQAGDSDIPSNQRAGFVRVKDLNGDGVLNAAGDRTVIGNQDAIYRWSLTNNFKYGNFNLMVMLNSLMGWQGINNLGALSSNVVGSGDGNFPGRAANFMDLGWWTPENRSNTRPSLAYSNPLLTGAGLVESRDFVRVQDVSLSYDLPRTLLNKWKIASIRVFVSARNLHTFTKWNGMDPESGYRDRLSLFPTPRTFVGGLNFSF